MSVTVPKDFQIILLTENDSYNYTEIILMPLYKHNVRLQSIDILKLEDLTPSKLK